MTFYDLPRPYHLTHDRLAIRAAIIRALRNPKVEITTAAIITFGLAFALAAQL